MQYVSTTPDPADPSGGCVFCDHLAEGDDASAGILHRGTTAFVLLNAFPYNTGHLMIAPLRHVGEMSELNADERHELIDLSDAAVSALREAMDPHGFNVGMNIGSAAGAGVPGHLHVHVVPRWSGDTNFMTTVGDTKVLPEMLAETDAKLRPLFERLGKSG